MQAKASFIYVNHEYHEERQNLKKALAQARERGLLGKNVLGSGFDIELEVFEGHGSYVAGEETAMLESMQGRSRSRNRRFIHRFASMANRPVNTLRRCAIFLGFCKGAGGSPDGDGKCPGTMMFSLSGAISDLVYEMPMGVTIRDLIEQCGGGVPNGRKIKAVFPGGPAFSMVMADQLNLPMDFDC